MSCCECCCGSVCAPHTTSRFSGSQMQMLITPNNALLLILEVAVDRCSVRLSAHDLGVSAAGSWSAALAQQGLGASRSLSQHKRRLLAVVKRKQAHQRAASRIRPFAGRQKIRGSARLDFSSVRHLRAFDLSRRRRRSRLALGGGDHTASSIVRQHRGIQQHSSYARQQSASDASRRFRSPTLRATRGRTTSRW